CPIENRVTSAGGDAGRGGVEVSKIGPPAPRAWRRVPVRMRICLLVAAVCLTARAAPVLADRDPNSRAPLPPQKHAPASPITDHFWIRATYFAPQARTTLRVDPSNAPPGTTGTPLSAENDLGLPKKLHQGRVDFMFRMRERSKVRVD